MFKLIIAVSAVFLIGCANSDPTLANFVERKGDGYYKSTSVGTVDGLDEAIKQCKMDGDKKLEIITTSTEPDYVLKKNLTIYVFKCLDRNS